MEQTLCKCGVFTEYENRIVLRLCEVPSTQCWVPGDPSSAGGPVWCWVPMDLSGAWGPVLVLGDPSGARGPVPALGARRPVPALPSARSQPGPGIPAPCACHVPGEQRPFWEDSSELSPSAVYAPSQSLCLASLCTGSFFYSVHRYVNIPCPGKHSFPLLSPSYWFMSRKRYFFFLKKKVNLLKLTFSMHVPCLSFGGKKCFPIL